MVFYGTPPVNGAFCEYVAADADFVYKLPETLTFEEGSLFEPLSVGIFAARKGAITAEDTVTILGAGPVGLLTLQTVKARGVTTVCITGHHDYQLKCAKELGATETINAHKVDPVKKIMELTGGNGTDVVIDVAGSIETGRQSFEIVKKGGRIIIIGIYPEQEFAIRMTDFVDKELTVKGVFRYVNTYPTALKLASAKKIELKKLITHTFPLSEIHKAFEVMDKKIGNPIKVIVKP
jgi:L-iditol 2-dehydrogenase